MFCASRVFICFLISFTYAYTSAESSGPDYGSMLSGHEQKWTNYDGQRDNYGRLNFMFIFIENINYIKDIIDSENIEGNQLIELPNIKKFKKESFIFDNVYSELHSSSSSATILTGFPAVETGMIKGKILPFTEIPSVASTGGLQYDHSTLAESIKHVTQIDEIPNYLTAFVGFWKLGHGNSGKYLPHNRGFDFWTGVSFPHSNSCAGKKKSFKGNWRKARAGLFYVDLIYDILPWLSGLFIGICSAYYFNVVSLKGLYNCVIYFFFASFVFFVFLEVYRVQKSATCLLFHMNEIAEQPYNMENLTLFFTTNVLALLDFFSQQSQPFFVNLNYVKMQTPHFSSKYFKSNESEDKIINSLLEIDWSIGKIMAKFDELQLTNNTMIILTGNNDCNISSQNQMSFIAYERNAENSFLPTSVTDMAERCMKVPMYVKQSKLKTARARTSIPVSFLDFTPTVLELLTNMTQDDYAGCNMKYAIALDENDANEHLPRVYDLEQKGIIDEIIQNKHRCNPLNRLHFHFIDIRKAASVTIGNSFRIIFSTVDEHGNANTLKYPVIRILQKSLKMENISVSYLEELYQNVSHAVESYQLKRRNKWSSQFEMPVYPWNLPCANFPKCEVFNQILSDFSFLEPIKPGLVTPQKDKLNT